MTLQELSGNGRIRWWVRNIAGALVVASVTGGLSVVWSASNAWTRIDTLERQMQIVAPLAERLARLEGKVDDISDGVRELARLIRQAPGDRR